MCGIIAVLRQRSTRVAPSGSDLTDGLGVAAAHLAAAGNAGALADDVTAAARALTEVDVMLRGVPGVQALLAESGLADAIEGNLDGIRARSLELEQGLDAGTLAVDDDDLERVNAALLSLKDAIWGIARDRVPTARAVGALAGGSDAGEAALGGYLSVQVALSALDRLEVRGRDSAGLHLLVDGHDLDLTEPTIVAELEARGGRLFTDGSVRAADGRLGFVYKAAAEIGELGDNTATLRAAITADALLRRALAAPSAEVTVLGHTRWASVGIISEPNAHPLNSEEEGGPAVRTSSARSTATSTTTPSSRRRAACASRPRSPPMPR